MTTATLAPAAPADVPGMYQQIGTITRQLHDALRELGVMPKLQAAAGDLPDARSRLNYVATKTGEAAGRVLDCVDSAKADRRAVLAAVGEAEGYLSSVSLGAEGAGALAASLKHAREAADRIDGHLTEIMVAQDFHDLTGQVMARVMRLATDLEENLVKLLCDAAPAERQAVASTAAHSATVLHGPAYEAERGADVVADQGEVDDLLASLGF